MRIKLFLAFLLVILITLGSVVFYVRDNTAEEIRNFMFRGGVYDLEGLVKDLENCYQESSSWDSCQSLLTQHQSSAFPPGEPRRGNQTENTSRGPGRIRGLQLIDPDGRVISDTESSTAGTQVSEDYLDKSIPLRVDGQTIGYLASENALIFTSAQETKLVSQLNRAALTAAVIGGAVAVILAFYLSYQLIVPIKNLTRAADNLRKGDLSTRVSTTGNNELAALGEVFNQMAASLQEEEERRKTLTADIAHELRTPLSVQRAHLEALQDQVYELTLENLQPIQDQNQNLIRLVEDLRTLTLAEARELALERTSTDLIPLIDKTISLFQPEAERKGLNTSQTTLEKQNETSLFVDPRRIEQIINNLLSNAIRYSPPGSTIHIQTHYFPDRVAVTVRDEGEGLTKQELAYLFQRFYKGDQSREKLDSGSGLGLAISKKLAQAHQGDLSASNHPQGGAVFTLSLPYSSSDKSDPQE